MRTKNGSVRELIAGIRQAAEQEAYNPAEDLKALQTQYKRLGRKDFGLPDPWAFNRCHYDAARKTLYIFDELTRLRTSNEETAKLVQQRIESWESVTADSAEMKSCADYRAFGILCREAVKGPGSVNQSMKWLQGLAAIVIDPHRCPDTAKEFSEYEYEVGRDGTVLPGYVDADNHHIDAVRYAVNRIWMRRGA